MLVHYAFGGGFGHLTRTQVLRHSLALSGPCATLCASPLAEEADFKQALRPRFAAPGLATNPQALGQWLLDELGRLQARTLYVDVFPGGILGELCGLSLPDDLELVLVARLLKWETYAQILKGPLPRFSRALLTEALPADQLQRLRSVSAELSPVALVDSPASSAQMAQLDAILTRWKQFERPVWLLVHAGAQTEIAELFAYACECARSEGVVPHWVLVAPEQPLADFGNIEWLNFRPARMLFPHVARIFTAAGFNAMRETAQWQHKHHCLPFARRYDDQFLRKRLRQGADQYV